MTRGGSRSRDPPRYNSRRLADNKSDQAGTAIDDLTVARRAYLQVLGRLAERNREAHDVRRALEVVLREVREAGHGALADRLESATRGLFAASARSGCRAVRGVIGISEGAYACNACGGTGSGWRVLRQSPPGFMNWRLGRNGLTQPEFEYWLDALRAHNPRHPRLRRLPQDEELPFDRR